MIAILELSGLYREGDGLFERLRRARKRGDVARLVRALRRWHGKLRQAASRYSTPLETALWKMHPRRKEIARIGNVQLVGRHAHRLLLVTTATALYRLAPHLASAKPARKTGPKARHVDKQIAEARALLKSGAAGSKLQAAKQTVKRLGRGDCQSDNAAVDYIRDRI